MKGKQLFSCFCGVFVPFFLAFHNTTATFSNFDVPSALKIDFSHVAVCSSDQVDSKYIHAIQQGCK